MHRPRKWFLVGAFWVASSVLSAAPSDVSGSAANAGSGPGAILPFLAVDEEIGAPPRSEDALGTYRSLRASVASCEGTAGNRYEKQDCLLHLLRDPARLIPTPQPEAPESSMVTHALLSGEGTCAALVAVLLALGEDTGVPIQALILRNHVLLADRQAPGVYWEVLEGGRRRTAMALRRFPQAPGGPVWAGAGGYLPFYVDNLASRFAKAGQATTAERLFVIALRHGGNAPRLQYNYATFLLQQGRNEEALARIREAIRGGWSDADAFVNRGVALWRLKRVRAARRSFQEALKLDPSHPLVRENLRRLNHRGHDRPAEGIPLNR